MKGGFAYILASKFGVLYVGVTNHLSRRIVEHRVKMTDGFSARYNVNRLVYYERFGDIRNAIAREKQIKGWLRAKKIALIESVNPSWKDLAEGFPVIP
ncbi:MAG: GIY-YIG nuclease family protein [Candidatus Acidiferrales bacterium]